MKVLGYKGYGIELDDKDGKFSAHNKDGQTVTSGENLQAVKANIDRISKRRFGQIVWYKSESYDGPIEFVKAKVTSVQEKQSYSGRMARSYRVTWKVKDGTSWSDDPAERLYKDTEDNAARIGAIVDTSREIVRLKAAIEKLKGQLEHYTDEELMGSE